MALLPLIKPTTCETAYFGGIEIVVRHQVPLFDPAFLLLRQLAKHLSEVLSQLSVQRLPAALGNENNMIFALPLAVA